MYPGSARQTGFAADSAGRQGDAIDTRGKEIVMSTADKASNKAEEVKGKVKETTGQAVGNDRLEAEGVADQTKGNLKQAGEKVKDAAKNLKP
jgi:uncharacterized protein YjbJ (UPF0337 family)